MVAESIPGSAENVKEMIVSYPTTAGVGKYYMVRGRMFVRISSNCLALFLIWP